MANRQPVIIEELGAPNALLVLDAKNRPEPPVQVGMRRRSRQVWMPGSDQATVHDMGVSYDPITIKGRFHDDFFRLLGESPLDLVRQAEGICLRGNACTLTWGDTIVRRGRLKEVRPSYVRRDDIIYEFLFEVDAAEEEGLQVYTPSALVTKAAKLRDLANRVIEIASIATFVLSAAWDIGTAKRRNRENAQDTDLSALGGLFDNTADPDAGTEDPPDSVEDLF